jgi:DNA repair photolyase
MDSTQHIGITETSDPAFHLDIFDNLKTANIIITKSLTGKLIEKLVQYKSSCILHCTCTGMGGSKIEPFVPTVEQTVKKMQKLIDEGFPVNQIVLRIDPIVPTEKGVNTAINVLNAFKDFGITRVRLSFLDMYKHVKERFEDNDIKLPYETFHADSKTRLNAFAKLETLAKELGYQQVLTCGEPGFIETPCISQTDIDILGLTDKITLIGKKEQRTSCGCPSNKRELIPFKDRNEHKCGHGCLYCYMKD